MGKTKSRFTWCYNAWNVPDFPMQTGVKTVPFVVAEEAYKEYIIRHGTRTSLEWLGERGGFGAAELAILLYERVKRIENMLIDLELGQI